MSIREKLGELGKALIGQSDEIKFRREVAAYAASRNLSPAEAEKAVLLGRILNVQTELRANSIINSQSEDFKKLRVALKAIFGLEDINNFTRDSSDPMIYRSMAITPVSGAEIARVQSYFSKKFNGKVPTYGVIRDTVDDMKLISGLMQRFSADPRIHGMGPLDGILKAHPELGADIGKILEAQKSAENHERQFDKYLRRESSIEAFKETTQNSLAEIFWRAPLDFVVNITKSGFQSKGFGDITTALLKETARFTGRTLLAGAKLLDQSVRTAGTLLGE